MIDCCDSQSLFEDADVLKQLYPTLRRIIASKMTIKKDANGRKAARAAQKAVERERVQKALTLNSALVKESRASVLAKWQPGVAGKGKKAATSLKKALMKPVSQI